MTNSEHIPNGQVSEAVVREMLAGLDGVPAGPWSAHMDDLTLHVERSHFIPDNYTLALCATGDHAYKLTPHLARCDPDTMRQVLTLALDALTRRSSAGVKDDKPFMWGIQGEDGQPYFDEHCVSSDADELEERGLIGCKVVPLYTRPSPPPQGETKIEAQPIHALPMPPYDFQGNAALAPSPTLTDAEVERQVEALYFAIERHVKSTIAGNVNAALITNRLRSVMRAALIASRQSTSGNQDGGKP